MMIRNLGTVGPFGGVVIDLVTHGERMFVLIKGGAEEELSAVEARAVGAAGA
jgi:hypothetical protein